MKLLIVDDEELTRTGVISSIDWQSIGIQEVLQADDGINGIEMARVHRPDIVLCDVRMPRLDGIAMLEQLEEILPDIVPVFMSGYSDKEYLKAAIKIEPRGIYYYFAAYIRYDYHERKFLNVEPNYKQLLQMAQERGYSEYDLEQLYGMLEVKRPRVL